MKFTQRSIGRDEAIRLGNSHWWDGLPAKQVALVGLLTQELCLPFDVLHHATEEALGRPVFTHEFGLTFDGIVEELIGERPAPSFEEIIGLIPKDKLIVVTP